MTEVNYNDGNWWGWNGGECPVHPESTIEARFLRSNAPVKNFARAFLWFHDGHDDDIIAFRVIKEYKDPREVWIGIDANSNRHIFDQKPDEFVTGWREGKNLTKYREVLE
jgi:hypothetical protein